MTGSELTTGDRAFLEAVRKYDHSVLQLALALTGDEDSAAAIYQAVFRSPGMRAGGFTSERSMQVAAYRLTARLCLDHLGRSRRVKSDLTPHERIVFELRHYHGVRLAVIGEILDISEDTARNTMLRALSRMRPIATSSSRRPQATRV